MLFNLTSRIFTRNNKRANFIFHFLKFLFFPLFPAIGNTSGPRSLIEVASSLEYYKRKRIIDKTLLSKAGDPWEGVSVVLEPCQNLMGGGREKFVQLILIR